jgi:Domain of unknown function (DUF5615)
MSQAARITHGVAMLLLAACFMALVPFMKDVSPQAGPGMAICGLFCGLIAVACLSTASQPVTIRTIGGTVFLLGQSGRGKSVPGAARSALGTSAPARCPESQPCGSTAPRAQHRSRLGSAMSRPRFLPDNDLNDAIVVGVRRREPAIEFARLRELDLTKQSDPEVLEFASHENWTVVSQDVNTMTEAAGTRLRAGLSCLNSRPKPRTVSTQFNRLIPSLSTIWAR